MRIFGVDISLANRKPQTSPVPRGPLTLSAVSGAPDKARGTDTLPFTGRKATGSTSGNVPSASNLAGAVNRKSVESPDFILSDGLAFWYAYSQRKKNQTLGLAPSFDVQDFASWDFDDLAELLGDLSPEVSKAMWDYLLLCNPGFELKAYKPGTTEVDDKAQKALDDLKDTIEAQHGTLGIFFDRLFKMYFLRGSTLMELVLADNARDFAGIATPDTKTLQFRRTTDPVMGQTWDFGQNQRGVFVSLKLPNIVYTPLHPSPDSIEGHPIVSPAIFAAIFVMAVLRDTKRVVQNQGYMRLDVQIEFEKLVNTIPVEMQSNPEKIQAWMNDTVEAVQKVYDNLQPDDTYIHADSITVNKPAGTADSDALKAIDSLFSFLERMLVRALKTMPLLMATNQSRSETQANREWEIYAQGIDVIQHLVESPFERLCTMALNAQGIQADVSCKFAVFRAAELLRDAQVDLLRAKTARVNYDNGYISQDEAAHYAVPSKEKADATEPRAVSTPQDLSTKETISEAADANSNPGENRISPMLAKRVMGVLRSPTLTDLDNAEDFIRALDDDSLLVELLAAEVADEEPVN